MLILGVQKGAKQPLLLLLLLPLLLLLLLLLLIIVIIIAIPVTHWNHRKELQSWIDSLWCACVSVQEAVPLCVELSEALGAGVTMPSAWMSPSPLHMKRSLSGGRVAVTGGLYPISFHLCRRLLCLRSWKSIVPDKCHFFLDFTPVSCDFGFKWATGELAGVGAPVGKSTC